MSTASTKPVKTEYFQLRSAKCKIQQRGQHPQVGRQQQRGDAQADQQTGAKLSLQKAANLSPDELVQVQFAEARTLRSGVRC